MTSIRCPDCGAQAQGNFCSSCGAALRGIPCPSCGTETDPGNRFCTECGARVRRPEASQGTGDPASRGVESTPAAPSAGQGGSRPSDLGWWVAGGLFLGVLLLVAYPTVFDGGGEDAAGASGQPSGNWADAQGELGPAPNVDLSGMSSREAADALFDRSMNALSTGDSAQVATFLPKAIEAYGAARPLDADGKFHLSLLQRVAFRFQESLETAERALEEHPNHLLNLWAAAAAAKDMGEEEVAERYYARALEVWDEERQRDLPEYEAHRPLLETVEADAREFLDGER